jgi:hypothetical protein
MALPVGLLADALGERNALTAMGVCVCGIVLVLSVALARTRSAHSVLPPQPADSAANDSQRGP